MRFELTKYNTETAEKHLREVEGKTVMVDGMSLDGVTAIKIEESEMYDGDPDPDNGYDGGKHELIDLIFIMGESKACCSFEPEIQHCEITFEQDDLWVITIEDLKAYVERQRFDLDFKLKEYEEHMSR